MLRIEANTYFEDRNKAEKFNLRLISGNFINVNLRTLVIHSRRGELTMIQRSIRR